MDPTCVFLKIANSWTSASEGRRRKNYVSSHISSSSVKSKNKICYPFLLFPENSDIFITSTFVFATKACLQFLSKALRFGFSFLSSFAVIVVDSPSRWNELGWGYTKETAVLILIWGTNKRIRFHFVCQFKVWVLITFWDWLKR